MARPKLPGGYVFRPTDMDLLGYLALFVTGKLVLSNVPIAEKNLYSGIEPWEVFESSKERVLYFFTPLKKRSPGNSRYRRTIGDGKGTWKAQDKGKPVYRYDNDEDEDDNKRSGQLIGYKRSLRYENRGSKHDGQFLMKEYYLPDKIRATLKAPLKDTVLCRIKRKPDRDIAVPENESIEARDIGDIIGDLKSGVEGSATALTLAMSEYHFSEGNSLLETSPSPSH